MKVLLCVAAGALVTYAVSVAVRRFLAKLIEALSNATWGK